MITPLEPPYDEAQQVVLSAFSRDGAKPLGLFRLLAHNPKLLESFMVYGGYNLSRRSPLSIHQRELIIFRAVGRAGGRYEWGMHELLYREKAELSEAQTRSCVLGSSSDECWQDPEDQLIIRAVDDLHSNNKVSEAVLKELESTFEPAQVIDIILIAGWYRTIATLTESLELALEENAPAFP